MTPTADGKSFKSFRAVCPKTRRQHAKVYSRATSGVARSFLREVVEKLAPAGIQVDGGSEFEGVFEDECEALGLPLKVLPPRSPELNGIVERANRSERIECWSQHRGEPTCAALNESQERWLDYYNNRRPHRSLGMRTPVQAAVDMGMAA